MIKRRESGTWVQRTMKVRQSGVWVPVTLRKRVSGAWVPAPAAPGGWPDPPAGMVEWARYEMLEGSGLPQDTSGNDRHFTSLGGWTWGTEGGFDCLVGDAGGDRAEFGGEGYAPIGGTAMRLRMAVTGTAGGMDLVQNNGGGGTTRVRVSLDENGGLPFFIFGVENGTSGDNGYWNGETFALDTIVDVLLYQTDGGDKGIIFYDPDDRTTVIDSNSGTNAGGYLTSGTTDESHVRLFPNSDRDVRLIDLTLYEDA